MALNINGTTGISGVDGSVSAPALTGTDSNTGITFPSADTIKFSTGGVERMAITNSGISGITAGITEADTWRLTSNFSLPTSSTVLTSNFERADGATATYIGSGMSESSGVFTFPSTGIWLIIFNASWTTNSAGESDYNRCNIQVTTNNSSYTDVAETSNYLPGTGGTDEGSAHSIRAMFDVTDTANCKVRFKSYVQNNSSGLRGTSSQNLTTATFMRIGDT